MDDGNFLELENSLSRWSEKELFFKLNLMFVVLIQ